MLKWNCLGNMLWEGFLMLRFIDDLAGAVYDIFKFIVRSMSYFLVDYNCCNSNVSDSLGIRFILVNKIAHKVFLKCALLLEPGR